MQYLGKELKKACSEAEKLADRVGHFALWWLSMVKELNGLEQSILHLAPGIVTSTCFNGTRKDWESLKATFFNYQREVTLIQDRFPLLLNPTNTYSGGQYFLPTIENVKTRHTSYLHVFMRWAVHLLR